MLLALLAAMQALSTAGALAADADSWKSTSMSLPINERLSPGATSEISHGWALPANGHVQATPLATLTASQRSGKKGQPREFQATISAGDSGEQIGKCLDELLEAALNRDDKTKALNNAVAHYRTGTQRVVAEVKDAFDYLVPYRGFGPSSEAGDVILDEKVKLKSRASAEYARQKHIDETHIGVVTSVMQMAMGLGMVDREKGEKATATGYDRLKGLAGCEEADKTLSMLSSWKSDLSVPEVIYQQGAWDVVQRAEHVDQIVKASLERDTVVQQIKQRIHKYNHKSKFTRASAKVIQTTLGVASLTPTFIGPAAKATLLAYIMFTGGPEQCKIMKQLYLDKRLDSRWRVISEEAHIALENYQIGILTRNPLLIACSESLLSEMAGVKAAKEALGHMVLSLEEKDAGP